MRRALQCKPGSLFIRWHTRAAQKSEDGLCKTAAIAGSIFKVKALNHLWLRPISQPFIYKGKEISSTSVILRINPQQTLSLCRLLGGTGRHTILHTYPWERKGLFGWEEVLGIGVHRWPSKAGSYFTPTTRDSASSQISVGYRKYSCLYDPSEQTVSLLHYWGKGGQPGVFGSVVFLEILSSSFSSSPFRGRKRCR